MSKIQKELSKATGVEPKKGEARQAFLAALVVAIAKLSDKEWDALTDAAQDWFNASAAAKKKNKDFPEFEDYVEEPDEQEEEPAPRRSRGKADKEEDAAVLKVGVRCKITNKRGKVYEGEVVELDKEIVVVKDADGEEHEIQRDRIEATEVYHGSAEPEGADEPEGPAEPAVGDTVKVTNTRGKVYEGEVTELDDDVIVVGDDEISRDKVKDIEIVKAAKKARGASKDADDEKPARGRAKADADEAADDKPKRASNPAGVSVGGRIRELLCEDPDMSLEDIDKALTKEKIAFRPASSKMIFKDVQHVFSELRKNKKMK